jgi:hypothetical protein
MTVWVLSSASSHMPLGPTAAACFAGVCHHPQAARLIIQTADRGTIMITHVVVEPQPTMHVGNTPRLCHYTTTRDTLMAVHRAPADRGEIGAVNAAVQVSRTCANAAASLSARCHNVAAAALRSVGLLLLRINSSRGKCFVGGTAPGANRISC